jgi:peptide chain release factor subunit 1
LVDKSQEGNQFAAGFGGVGGLLRYPLDLSGLDGVADDDEYYQSDDDVM